LPDGAVFPFPFIAAVDCCASVDVTVVLDTACLEPLDLLPLEDPGKLFKNRKISYKFHG
jgi:hypothetical protein